MKHPSRTKAFTLIEIIVAVAIVVTITSAIFGTYAAAAHSTTRAAAQARLTQQARSLIEKMTAQLRSTFWQDSSSTKQEQKQQTSQVASNLPKHQLPPSLQAGANTLNSQTDLLCLVTTAAIFTDTTLAKGPFVARYRYDPAHNRLLYHQGWLASAAKTNTVSGLAGTNRALSQTDPPPSQWAPLAENVKAIELTFWDGHRWRHDWNSRKQEGLPRAVKIELVLADDRAALTTIWTSTVCLTSGPHTKAPQPGNTLTRPFS